MRARVHRPHEREARGDAAQRGHQGLELHRVVDVAGAVQGDEAVAARVQAEARERVSAARLRQEPLQGVDHGVADEVDLGGGRCPRAPGCRAALRSVVKSRSASWSVSSRLSSSGMPRSPLRRPASTCATGMPSLAAQSAAAMVELTSPTTTTRSGRSRSSTGSRRSSTCAVCDGVRARADAEVVVGLRQPELLEEDVAEAGVVVLAGVHEGLREVDAARRRAGAVAGGAGVPRLDGRHDRRDLHEVGARAADDDELECWARRHGTSTIATSDRTRATRPPPEGRLRETASQRFEHTTRRAGMAAARRRERAGLLWASAVVERPVTGADEARRREDEVMRPGTRRGRTLGRYRITTVPRPLNDCS